MSEDGIPRVSVSNLKKKFQASNSINSETSQRVSSIVAKSKDPSSFSLSSSLKKRPTENTASFLSSSLLSTDDLIKKNRRKSFGESKEKDDKEKSSSTTTTTTTTASKLKPKSTLTSSLSSSSHIATYTESLKDHSSEPKEKEKEKEKDKSTPTTPSNVVKKLKRKSIESGNIFQFDQAKESLSTSLGTSSSLSSSTTTPTTAAATTPSSSSSSISKDKEPKESNKKKLRVSIQSSQTTENDENENQLEEPQQQQQTEEKSSKKKVAKTSSLESTGEKKKKRSSTSGTSKKSLTFDSIKSMMDDENDIDYEKDDNNGGGGEKEKEKEKKKKKKKSSTKKVSTFEGDENDNNKEGMVVEEQQQQQQSQPIFDGSSSVIGTTSNVINKQSKAYPKTPLPNKSKKASYDFEDESEVNNNFMSSVNSSRMYFTPKATFGQPSTPSSSATNYHNRTNVSIHNYPNSPISFESEQQNQQGGFEYSDSPVSIPNISYITPSERDISFDTDHQAADYLEGDEFVDQEEDFFNNSDDEELQYVQQQAYQRRKEAKQQQAKQLKEQQKRHKQQVISQSKGVTVITSDNNSDSKAKFVLLVITFTIWIGLLIILAQFFYHYNDIKYCDTGAVPKKINDTTFSCVPCPDKGVCMNGIFENCMDGYVIRNGECILNPSKVESLVQIINQISQILRDRKGLFECGSKDTFLMTNDELKKEIAKRNWFSKDQAIESFDTIIQFIDNRKDPEEIGLDHKLLSSIGYTFEDNQFKYYSNESGIRPLWCQTIFFFKNLIKNNLHFIGIFVIGFLGFKLVQIRKKNKQEELLAIEHNCKKALKILQQRTQFEDPWISELILKDEVMGSNNDKKSNLIWEKTLEKISSNVRVLCTVKLIHGESQKTLEWTDSNQTPRRSSVSSPINYDDDELINNSF
ncbi:hypothetical protein ACTFIU_004238 [Dictyostelium citrinum]